MPTSAQINTPEEEQITPEEDEEAAAVVGTVAVAAEIMVEAEAEETKMTLQGRAVTSDKYNRAA